MIWNVLIQNVSIQNVLIRNVLIRNEVRKIAAHYATNAVGVVDSSRTLHGRSPCNRTGNVLILAMPYGRRESVTALCRLQSPVVAANRRCHADEIAALRSQ